MKSHKNSLPPCGHDDCVMPQCIRRQEAKAAGVWPLGSDRDLPIGRKAARRIRRFARRLLKFEDVRLSSPRSGGFVFVVAQRLRHTSDFDGIWLDEKGEERAWYYYEQQVICSGRNEEELKESVQLYYGASKQDGLEFLMRAAGFSEELKEETRKYLNQYGSQFNGNKKGDFRALW